MKINDLKEGQTVWLKGVSDGFGFINLYDDEGNEFDYISEYDAKEMKREDLQLDRLDQPKPLVPQFVADWYEEHKLRLEVELLFLCWKIREIYAEGDFEKWFEKYDKSIQTLINMDQYGYTVEKEKLYTVKILGCTLFKMTSDNGTEYKLIGENETPSESKFSSYKFEADLTEQEIKQADERLWQFRKEVTE